MQKIYYGMFGLMVFLWTWPVPAQEYSLADFDRVEKIDAHAHFSSDQPYILETARRLHFRFLGIAVDVDSQWEKVRQQDKVLRSLHRRFPDLIAYAPTFSMEGWDKPDWQDKVIRWLEGCIGERASGVKVWKNIGMEFRDRQEHLIMIDDQRFSPIMQFLESRGIPLIAHLGEPRNCWLPLDQMTTNNDRSYFRNHPQYHMALHPEMPSYEEQGKVRDRLLERHPKLRFDGCHLASLEWNVDVLAQWFEHFPEAVADMSARISHLQHQTIRDREKVRRFLIRYQDRLLYGTDSQFGEASDAKTRAEAMEKTWRSDWQYLTSDDPMESSRVEGKFRGLQLPRKVVDKIYRENFRRFFPKSFPD